MVMTFELSEIDVFKSLNETETNFIEDKCVFKDFVKDQFVYKPGDPSTTIFYLKSGRIKLGAINKDGKEMIKHIFVPGELFGLMTISGQKERVNFAKAMDEGTEVVGLNIFDLKNVMQSNVDFSLDLAKVMGNRIVEFQNKIESLMFKDTRTRVIELIKDLADRLGKPIGEEILIKHNLTHQDFASLTATTRQTVTSIFSELKKKDLIYMERGKILVRDMKALF